jgi:hypothetical protein
MNVDMRTSKQQRAATPASKWTPIWIGGRTSRARITGYIEVFRTTGSMYVTIPGVSRFRDLSIASAEDARMESL